VASTAEQDSVAIDVKLSNILALIISSTKRRIDDPRQLVRSGQGLIGLCSHSNTPRFQVSKKGEGNGTRRQKVLSGHMHMLAGGAHGEGQARNANERPHSQGKGTCVVRFSVYTQGCQESNLQLKPRLKDSSFATPPMRVKRIY
jgi:hypothetical protein